MKSNTPRIVVARQARPRASVPSPDSALTEAVVIAGCIAFLGLVYMFADLVSRTPR